jgi:hypothetical protein
VKIVGSAGDLVPVEDHQRADEPGGPLHVEAEPIQYAPVLQVCEGVFADSSVCGDQLVDLLLRGRELLALGLLAACDDRRVAAVVATTVEADEAEAGDRGEAGRSGRRGGRR